MAMEAAAARAKTSPQRHAMSATLCEYECALVHRLTPMLSTSADSAAYCRVFAAPSAVCPPTQHEDRHASKYTVRCPSSLASPLSFMFFAVALVVADWASSDLLLPLPFPRNRATTRNTRLFGYIGASAVWRASDWSNGSKSWQCHARGCTPALLHMFLEVARMEAIQKPQSQPTYLSFLCGNLQVCCRWRLGTEWVDLRGASQCRLLRVRA
eukprot:14550613-Alexandrium_andersonii.AAC.1